MDYDQFQFWQDVYVTSIRAGNPNVVAKAMADQAAKDYFITNEKEE